ncbi:hypothetical protein ALPR1_09530 [Algoriphagus machipongonensis]|uniref:Methyltransferase FkbM domain-containing protein n=1 Tax=Algoriphagus machipongonensis TaxID=388413 RepID=A3HRH7_9BACT|nr:hypothetical protein ALPR1_09530 [Algoriphagus machipongonensis]
MGSFFDFSVTSRVEKENVLKLIELLHPKISNKPLIRLGPARDGGYLIPDDLEGISACFSPGVDLESGFEYNLAEHGINVYMCDYTVEKPKLYHPNFHFIKKHLSSKNNDQFMTIDTWVNEVLPNDKSSDLILQMDIEGFEFECIFSLSQSLLNRFRIIVIEFHEIHRLFDKSYFKFFKAAIEKLLENHSVVHIHPNNIKTPKKINGIELYHFMEFTFVRNDHVKLESFSKEFPNHLDRDNTFNKGVILSNNWFR